MLGLSYMTFSEVLRYEVVHLILIAKEKEKSKEEIKFFIEVSKWIGI